VSASVSEVLRVVGPLAALAVAGGTWFYFFAGRTEDAQAVAARRGLRYDATAPADLRLDLIQAFHLFAGGQPAGQPANVLRGERNGLPFAVFDYCSASTVAGLRPPGDLPTTHTVFWHWSQRLHLPNFRVHPEGMLDIAAFDVDIVERPYFSDAYVLQGDRSLVTPLFVGELGALLERFHEEYHDVCVEASGGHVIVYSWRTPTRPGELDAFIDRAFEVVAALA
jgi:hypothetical protein